MSNEIAKISDCFQLSFYRFHSLLHWKAREHAITAALRFLKEETKNSLEFSRVVDLGCGHGLACKSVCELGNYYLGIDSDPASISHAVRTYSKYEKASFEISDIVRDVQQITSSDVILLNGVAHHLSDRQMKLLCNNVKACAALIVADHSGVESYGSFLTFISWSLQKLDKGKFIRSEKFFENLPGFDCIYSKPFTIKALGLPLWPYFCRAYTSS